MVNLVARGGWVHAMMVLFQQFHIITLRLQSFMVTSVVADYRIQCFAWELLIRIYATLP